MKGKSITGINPDLTIEEIMKSLRGYYLRNNLDEKEDSYAITLLKGDTPNKNCVTFTPEALANAVEDYNKTHKDSRLFINTEGNLAMSTYSYGRILEDGTVVEDKELGE